MLSPSASRSLKGSVELLLSTVFCCLSLLFFSACGESSSSSDDSSAAVEGVEITTDDCFSLDYVHPNPACQKLMTNLVIGALNSKYGTTYKKLSYKADATVDKQDKQDALGLTTLVTVGDSLLSGNQQVTAYDADPAKHVQHLYTLDNFGIYLAKSLGLNAGSGDDAEYRHPVTNNLGTEKSATAAQTRGIITNANNKERFHHFAFPSLPLVGIVDTNFTQLEASGAFTASLLGMWRQLFRGQTNVGVHDEVKALNPDVLVMNIGNNDLLAPAVRENIPLSSKDQFKTHYSNFLTAVAPDKTKVKIVLFKIANVGGAPYFDLKQTYTHMKALIPDTSAGALAPLLNGTLYGQTDDSVEAAGTQTTRQLDLTKDKLKVTAVSSLLQGLGTKEANPLPDDSWLSEKELASIQAKYVEYNAAIEEVATTWGASVVDTAADLSALVQNGKVTK